MDREPAGHFEEPVESPRPDLQDGLEGIDATESLIDALSERLGYVETDELIRLRGEWVEALRAGSEDLPEKAQAYQEQAEILDAVCRENFRLVRQRVTDAMSSGETTEATLGAARELGFTETEEMQVVRSRMAVIFSGHEVDESLVQEQIEVYERLADGVESVYGAKLQIGLLLVKATVQRDAGRLDAYREDLEDAQDYAYGMGFDEAVEAIGFELERGGDGD